MSARFLLAALATSALLGSLPAQAAAKLSRQFTGAREDEDKARSLTEHPLASQGLKGLREQGRSALRPAKIENKAEGKVLMATTTPAVRDLREIGVPNGPGLRNAPGLQSNLGQFQAPRLAGHEILRTNLPELLVVKALTAMGVSHDSLARFAMTQGQDGIQSGFGKVYRLGDSASLAQSLQRTGERSSDKPAKRSRRSAVAAGEANSR